ncbi:MAG: lycopene cyclase domain-containing protein [Candidatus Nanopelagicales bacterium]
MTYTQLSAVSIVLAVAADLWIFRTRLVTRRAFWASYAIILFFQLVTNGMFTGWQIVKYRDEAIIGGDSPAAAAPPFLGDGRIAFAPIEDLGFGFSLILLTLCGWVWLGRRGVQREPHAGPPRWRRN